MLISQEEGKNKEEIRKNLYNSLKGMKQETFPWPLQLSKKDEIMENESRLSFHGRKNVTKHGM